MSDRWWSYFEETMQDKHWLQEAVSQFQFMQPLYGMIQKNVPKGGRILDIGSGMGFNDIYLSSLGYRVTGIDNDERIVNKSNYYADKFGADCTFKLGDAFRLTEEYGQYDLVYSLGVLEHFDREVTVRLLEEQHKCANQVLIEIPSKYTALSSGISDERIYSMNELKSIVSDAGMNIKTHFGFGDVMVSKQQIWAKRLLPHGVYRLLQNNGFAFCLSVIGEGHAS